MKATGTRVWTALGFVGVLAWVGVALAQTPAGSDAAGKVREVLSQVNEAIGGAKAADLKSLSAKGEYRRVFGQNQMTGDFEWRILFPDRFQRVEYIERPDGTPAGTMTTTLDGEESWRDAQGGNMFFMRRPQGEGGEPRAAEGPRRPNAGRGIRAEYYRTLLGLLPGAPALTSLAFAHAGQAQAADAQTADIVDITGPENFKARLFVDSRTHLPLMLSYQSPDFRQMRRFAREGERPPSEEEARRMREELRKRMEAQGPPPMVETQWFFSDHKSVDGVTLPHRLTRQVAGEVQEELTINEYAINPDLKVEQFKNKKKTDE